MEVFRAKGLLDVLVVADDGGQLWLIPQIANGWALRTRCKTDPMLCERILTPAPADLGDGEVSLWEYYGLPVNGFGAIVAPVAVDNDEAPAQRRATRPTRMPPGRRSGLRRPASLRV
jgi:hypothetical protein